MTMLFPAFFISMEGAGRDTAHLPDTESMSSGGGKTTIWSADSGGPV